MKCGDIIGKGHVCRACQEEFSQEIAAKGRKKARVITVLGIGLLAFAYTRIPPGTISQFSKDVSTGSKELIPAIRGILESVKEPASLLDIQMRMVFAGVVLILIGSFALLSFARR